MLTDSAVSISVIATTTDASTHGVHPPEMVRSTRLLVTIDPLRAEQADFWIAPPPRGGLAGRAASR